MERFKGQNVLVTGAAAGLGRIIAQRFADEGANLAIIDRDDPSRAASELGGKGFVADVADEAQVVAAIGQVAEHFDGRIDVLVNNAGFNGKAQLVQDMKVADWNRTIGINLTGTMMVTREVIRHMQKQKAGRIVNIASNVARRGLPYRCDYVCSKWAVLGLTQTLALELAPHIRVNAVCPGPIEGDRIEQLVQMHADAEGKSFEEMHKAWEACPMGRFIRPQEVTDVVTFLASDASSAMTGQALNITGGFIMN